MSNAPRATMTKRQRELDQKDRVKAREARRADRKARSAERRASGEFGPPMGEPMAPLGDYSPDDVFPDGRPLAPAAPTLKEQLEKQGGRLYVGNLSYDTTSEALRALFSELGPVTDVHMVMDRDSGRPRGFAFVTMGTRTDAENAIRELDGRVVDGRPLRVNGAEDRARGGGGGRHGGGGGRY